MDITLAFWDSRGEVKYSLETPENSCVLSVQKVDKDCIGLAILQGEDAKANYIRQFLLVEDEYALPTSTDFAYVGTVILDEDMSEGVRAVSLFEVIKDES